MVDSLPGYDDWKTSPPEDDLFQYTCDRCDDTDIEEIKEDLISWECIDEGHNHREEDLRELWVEYMYDNPDEPDPDLGRDDY
jgi:hypothetical protein